MATAMTQFQEASDIKTRYDGNDLKAMFLAATRLFEHNVDLINALNVFPVPDGDTGTNMYLTLRDTLAKAESVSSASAGQVASAMAEGALWGAKGNSGVILSQFFRGIAQEFEGKADFGPVELASAFQRARENAYKAVGDPKEGTILTVISSVAESSQRCADSGGTMLDMIDAVCSAARETVALTPTMLPVLRQAGVVDAGGQGLSVILEGVRLNLNDEEAQAAEIAPPEAIGVEGGTGVVSQDFLAATTDELYGYCTQLLIEGQALDLDAVRAEMASLAQSTIVIGDENTLKIHVHAHDPGPIISFAVSLGTLSQVKIENMDEQHREYSVARRQVSIPETATTIVAVARGHGLETVFTDLGASRILSAGDTMNPSVREILDAVDSAPSDNVIFLPNNRNIVQAAKQAVELSSKTLRVVNSASIPQGVAAMLAFTPDTDLEANAIEMELALSTVRTGEICLAVRPVELNGVSVSEGQIIGILEHELVAAGDYPNEVLLSLLRKAEISEGDLITLYSGEPVTREDADTACNLVMNAFERVEVEVVAGRQPYYHYIVSIE